MSSSALLRGARDARGLSQRALARVSDVPQPRIAELETGRHDTTVSRLEELLVCLGHRVTILPTTARPVWEAGFAVADALARGDESAAWREVIQLSDDLAGAEPAVRVALCVAEPPNRGDARYEALLAALVDHWLTRDRLPRPAWVREPSRTVSPAWDVEPIAELRAAARAATPAAIARHGVYLAASELSSV